MRRELRDRYGPLPEEVETLLATQALRLVGGELGIERILVRPWDVRLNFRTAWCRGCRRCRRRWARYQFAVDVRRPLPLSLTLTRHGTEPIIHTIVAALRDLAADPAVAGGRRCRCWVQVLGC